MALQSHYRLRIWSHKKVLDTLTYICTQVLPPKDAAGIGTLVTMHCLEDGDCFSVGDINLQCFDIHSAKEIQYGFTGAFMFRMIWSGYNYKSGVPCHSEGFRMLLRPDECAFAIGK